MQIMTKILKRTLIVMLEGELDHHNASEISKKIEKEIYNRNPKNLIFDMSKLAFMDSSGIGVMLGRYKIISALGGKTAIVCKNKHIEKIIALSGLKKVMDVFPDIEKATANL